MVGETIDAAEFATEVIALNEYYCLNIEAALSLVPEGTDLHSGLELLEQKMNHPLSTYAADLIRDTSVKVIVKYYGKGLLKKLGASGGTILLVQVAVQTAGFLIDAPTIDKVNSACISAACTRQLRYALDSMNAEIASANPPALVNAMADHKLLSSMYFESLKATGKHTAACMKDSAYFEQKFNRYDEALNYDAYIRSCKELVAESM